MGTDITPVGLEPSEWLDPAIAGAIFVFSLVVALVVHKLLFPAILRHTRRTATDLDGRVVHTARLPFTLGIVVLGVYLALTVPLDLSEGQREVVGLVTGLLGIALGVAAIAGVVSDGFTWYMETVAPRTQTRLDQRMLPLLRRISAVVIYAIGGLLILDLLNINISPLVAGLGLGGLAVALALQPTLSNLFAGTYVMTEGVVTPGDYVELENGVAGYVIDVSWRSTRIRTFYNNLVIVPNSRFAETILTNYQEPAPAVNVIVNCGVSLDSDLYHVEDVCREVMDEVIHSSPDAVRTFNGWFGYESFGESNVYFWLFLQARDRIASFGLRTALMQRLRQRFTEEGIVINYPVRTLRLPDGLAPEVHLRGGEANAVARGNGGRSQRRRHRRSQGRGVHLPPDLGRGPEGSSGAPWGEGPERG